MNSEKDNLIQYILNLKETFNTENVNDYKLLVNVVYNNLMVLEEEDLEINEAVGALLMHVYNKLDEHSLEYFNINEQLFSHYLQGWMKDKK